MSFALYRKYRPQNFDELMGQSAVRRTLMEALKQGRLVHAYLFSGPRGIGKTTTARLIAKAIQCESRKETGEPCGSCTPCELNGKNELIDLIEIDAASNRGIDEIRDLREKIRFAPTHAKAKVYIIDEVHMLTKEAFNALLKSLEEPPAHVHFILATTEIHKIPETILSRCQRYDFKRMSEADIVERLKHIAAKESFTVEEEALALLAKYADGGMRDAISLLEQFASEALTVDLVKERLGLGSHQYCDELFAALGQGDTQKGLAVVEQLHKDGYDLKQFTLSFLGFMRQKLHMAIEGKKKGAVDKLLHWTELFDEAWIKLKQASIAQLPLEIAVIRATRVVATPEAAAPASPATPVAKATPQQSKRQEGLMHMDATKKQLPAALKLIKNPALRLSFQSGNLKKQEGEVLHFVFPSQFHYDKVNHADAIVQVEQALSQTLGKNVKLQLEVDEGMMATAKAPSAPKAPIDTMDWDVVEETL